jgi:hypothetical protein
LIESVLRLYVRPPVAITTSTSPFGLSRQPFPSMTAAGRLTARFFVLFGG